MRPAMKKEKLPIVILLATTLCLGIMLVVQHNSAADRDKAKKIEADKEIDGLTAQVSDLVDKLAAAENDSNSKTEQIGSLTTQLDTTSKENSALDTDLHRRWQG